jgi:mannose-6-phosphate isomerase-like protein (cupin superfamily)/hemerythrin-like domain-containing protein
VRRHATLVPLSHDHHRALVTARRLRLAAAGALEARLVAARAFLVFFAGHASGHLRDEEERIFPLLMEGRSEAPKELARALVEHAQLRSLATRMQSELTARNVTGATLRCVGDLLVAHVRLEERLLFPMIEEYATASLDLLDEPVLEDTLPSDDRAPVVDLARPIHGRGPQWGMESAELNATLLAWPEGEGFAEHRNTDRDVLLVVLDGAATVRVNGTDHEISDHELLLVPRGSLRMLAAGQGGVRYLSIHRRRDPLLPRSRHEET